LARHVLPLVIGVALTLTLRGYQFGGGNHCVYLVAPLREVHPELLARDWWTTHTLQYHVAFTKLTAGLMRLGIVEPAFVAFYLGLVALLHVAWLRIVRALGLDGRAYLLSVMLYYLSAGGTGLGTYQFLQDSSFLPGNVANVAMLWGVALWIEGRIWPAAGALAVASLFHLNHALVALAFWPLAAWLENVRRSGGMGNSTPLPVSSSRERHGQAGTLAHATRPSIAGAILPFALILLFALPNLIPAARLTLARIPKMPLKEFVDLYVHLRHPHHYDPLAWPGALWVSFLWPIPLAVIAYRRLGGSPGVRRAAFAFVFFVALLLVAFVFAGVVFVSEPLIQMSLFRFSIYPKLLSCVGAAAILLDPRLPARRAVRVGLLSLPVVAVAALLIVRLARPASTAGVFVESNLIALLIFCAILAGGVLFVLRPPSLRHPLSSILVPLLLLFLFVGWNRWLGLRVAMRDDSDRDYLAACRWARDHTPVDALFVVPPNEQLFRFHARRAIVVNFKNVPQLSSEMSEWRRRLEDVLDGRSLAELPKRFDLAHEAISRWYEEVPAERRAAVADRYGARYVLTARPIPGKPAVFENASYHLYDLTIVRAAP
jgi:hypothetical protein